MARVDGDYLYGLFSACLERQYFEIEGGGSFDFGYDGRTLYIFFEGSRGAEDWINNLDFIAEPYREMEQKWYCHGGFLRVWRSILPYLKDMIASETLAGVVTVGYSHGAAIALLCHEYVWFHRPDLRSKISSYGFGSPRVIYGRVPYERDRWRDFFVIKNRNDAITHLPPRILGFRHVGKLIEIGKSGKYSPIDAHRAESYLTELKML